TDLSEGEGDWTMRDYWKGLQIHPGRALADYPAAGSTVGPTLNGDQHPRPTLNGDKVGMRLCEIRDSTRLGARDCGPVGGSGGGREGGGKEDIDCAAVDAGQGDVARRMFCGPGSSQPNKRHKSCCQATINKRHRKRTCPSLRLTSSSIVVAPLLVVAASTLIVAASPPVLYSARTRAYSFLLAYISAQTSTQ
ncbi:hypothetical protein EV715DRAFT_268695, partial [Schizophyllum commune]